MKTPSPTPYSDVNEILNLLFDEIQGILQDHLIGMYLFGSLANGDFDEFSDIDVLIVTKAGIPQDFFSVLFAMHERVAEFGSPWAVQLEVSYIPQAALRRFDPADNLHPHIDRGSGEKLHWMRHASDWIVQRHILRERGVVLTGPKLDTLIDPVSPDDLRQAVANVLPLWVEPVLENPSQINKRGYQSFFVLSLCRMLYTIRHGTVVSKPLAARWAKENLDSKWTTLVERALIGRQNPSLDADSQDIQGTLEMMQYTLQQVKPTPYAEVNEVLCSLLSSVKEILADQFVGMYLYGSLSSGDFNPQTSDIDFLVVTKDGLPHETIDDLEAMHQRTWRTGFKRAGKLEGAYVPRELIRRHDTNGAPCPTVNEGRFYAASLGSDWIIQRHVLRETGVVVEGPHPKTLIDYVSPDDIRGAVMGTLYEWWFPMLDDPSWLRNRESGDRAFAVITMCRVLHALEYGTIVSKPKAIQWAQIRLDSSWKQLIDKAVAVSRHADLDVRLDETLDFIRFTREQVK
jgi:predicted nucleotidyltransferase